MGSYGSAAKWFHWITVVLLGIAIPFGFVIEHIKDDVEDALLHACMNRPG